MHSWGMKLVNKNPSDKYVCQVVIKMPEGSRFPDCLIGLVVIRPPQEQKIPGWNPACARIFSGSSHTNGTPVATMPGTWHYRVNAGTGQPSVSIL